MTIDKKTIAIIVLSILVLVFGWIAFKPSPKNLNEELINAEVERLNKENTELANQNASLLVGIKNRDIKIATSERLSDSLNSLIPKIKQYYDKKYKNIDNASAISIANDFTNVFTNAGVK